MDNIRTMDWKRLYYLRGEVIDHPRYGRENSTVITDGTFCMSCKLQIRVCWLQLDYKAPTLIGGWTGYGYCRVANNSITRCKLKGEV